MRGILPATFLALGACSGGEDPEALLQKFEEAWTRSDRLRVEVEVRGRLVVERQTADQDVSQVSLLIGGDNVYFAISEPGGELPYAAYILEGKSLTIAQQPKDVVVQLLQRPAATSVRRGLARGGVYGGVLTILAAGKGVASPESRIQVSRPKYLGLEKVGEVDAHLLQYNFAVTGDWPYRAVARVWINPATFAPLKREIQGARQGAKEVSVETYLRFERE
jgi:hypothetical protein